MKYHFEEKLYENKQSQLWKAIGEDSNEYAIKCISLEDYDFDMITTEASIMRTLNHPNIIKYYESYLDDESVNIVMELAKGSVYDILKEKYPMGLEEKYISVILRQVLLGLQELHENNIIHRDIKAGNLLISNDFTIKLTDFGVSAKISFSNPKRTTFTGTLCWMAPEILDDRRKNGYTKEIDIWSLGITALELAVGVPPGHKQTPLKRMLNIINDDPPNPKEIGKKRNRTLSWKFRNFVKACLNKDPEKRETIDKLLNFWFIKKYKKIDPSVINELY